MCLPCGVLIYEDSLEDHYFQSPAYHPSCKQCSRGFKDDRGWAEVRISSVEVQSLSSLGQQHMALGHPDLRCEKCERQFETVEAVQIHYFASPMHPECTFCNRGFKDDVECSVVRMDFFAELSY
jgi:hypothetical protein